MLTIGSDTYITVEEADAYIDTAFSSFDTEAINWAVLDEKDKEVFLRRSLIEIESLMYTGSKFSYDQTLNFPRRYPPEFGYSCGSHMPHRYYWADSGEVPQAVKDAQADNAIAIMKAAFAKRSDSQFKTLSTLGAQKNIKYNKRDQDLGADVLTQSHAPQVYTRKLHSEASERLLRPYTGSYRM